METIFISIFSYVSGSVLSGITWDVIKGSGQKIVDSFKEKFKGNNYFINDEQCDNFLEIVFDKKSTSKKRPFNDLRVEYEELTDKNYTEEFECLFSDWINENKIFFEKYNNNSINQSGTININGHQNVSNGGAIYNIVNQVKH